MGPDILRRVCSEVQTLNCPENHLTILWHAGEPLAVGQKFYRDAFKIIRDSLPSHLTVSHRIVTNGTLIDDWWCDLFRECRVQVVVSVDGPSELHDQKRKRRSGIGSHASVLRGIRALNARGIEAEYICVISDHNIDNPNEVFSFFDSIAATKVSFNVEEVG